MDQPQSIRLNKFLAERLGLSRREADEAIVAGRVKIGDTVAQLGARVDFTSKVWYNGNIIPFNTDYLYIAFNKPVGYVCSRRAQGGAPTVYDLLPAKYRQLKTVGRLDKDSSGLIILTNDGDFAYQMTHPKFHKDKVYEVELDRPLEPLHQQMISDYGVMLDDGPSKFTVIKNEPAVSPAKDHKLGRAPSSASEAGGTRAHYIVKLSEGRNRQIRRTFAALGYRVTALHRTQFGPYQLAGLATGRYEEIAKA
ncbi:rRNA pseudouridine synthase [Candidatus Saccharibacteria bacterium]|nr:rRNA pseudouridine synthase [Candidatus Saccharibacteria bacterium]